MRGGIRIGRQNDYLIKANIIVSSDELPKNIFVGYETIHDT